MTLVGYYKAATTKSSRSQRVLLLLSCLFFSRRHESILEDTCGLTDLVFCDHRNHLRKPRAALVPLTLSSSQPPEPKPLGLLGFIFTFCCVHADASFQLCYMGCWTASPSLVSAPLRWLCHSDCGFSWPSFWFLVEKALSIVIL